MQCDQSTHMSGLSFEHMKTTYQVPLKLNSPPPLPPPPLPPPKRAHDRPSSNVHLTMPPILLLQNTCLLPRFGLIRNPPPSQAHLTLNTKLSC
jgi:hypothetical protein